MHCLNVTENNGTLMVSSCANDFQISSLWLYSENSSVLFTVVTNLGPIVQLSLVKVMMNKWCVHLFIIIFIDVYRQSKYIPTVTNFVSILANCFYFLRKITALRPSVLNFWGRLVEFCQKCSEQTTKKWLYWLRFTKNGTQNFMQRPHFECCLKIAIDST